MEDINVVPCDHRQIHRNQIHTVINMIYPNSYDTNVVKLGFQIVSKCISTMSSSSSVGAHVYKDGILLYQLR